MNLIERNVFSRFDFKKFAAKIGEICHEDNPRNQQVKKIPDISVDESLTQQCHKAEKKVKDILINLCPSCIP